MASFKKSGKIWRAWVSKGGVRLSGTFDTKMEAVAWAVVKESEIVSGKHKATSKTIHTFDAALDKYLEEETPKGRSVIWETNKIEFMRRTIKFVGTLMHKISPIDIENWRDARSTNMVGAAGKEKLISQASVRRDMNLLSSIFETARKEWKWISTNPVHEVERPKNSKSRNRRVSKKEIDTMMDALNYVRDTRPTKSTHRVAVAFLLAVETGMRQGEIMTLEWVDVHIEHRYVHLNMTKNGDERDVPLSPRAVELLNLLDRDRAKCFPITAACCESTWRNARTKTNIKDLHFHDSRHEAVTQLAKKLELLDLAKMIGHRDIKSLMIYYNPTATEMADRLAA